MPDKAIKSAPTSNTDPGIKLTDSELATLRKDGEADMAKHGFKTPEEYVEWIDSRRGY